MLRLPKIGTALFCAVTFLLTFASAQFIGDDFKGASKDGKFSNRDCYKNNFP